MNDICVLNGALLSPTAEDRAVPWWSFGKCVIAAAALVQVQKKLLSLDEPVHGSSYSLRQLLRHQSGLPEYGELPEYRAAVEAGEPPWPEEEMLARVDAQRLRYTPGSGWAYSNVGYFLVRRLIERSADDDFEAALRRLVLQPLAVETARLARAPADLAGIDMGDAGNYDPRWVYHGLLVGPLSAAALLLDRLLSGGLLGEELLTAMLDTHPVGGPIAGRPWLAPAYGLGIMAGKVEGGITVAGHTGGGPGSCVAVYRRTDPGERRCCAAFLAGANAGRVENEAMRRLMDEPAEERPDT